MVKRHYGVRTDRYKQIHFYNDIDKWELFDLEKDFEEMHNVLDGPSYDGILDRMKEELHRLQRQYNDIVFEK